MSEIAVEIFQIQRVLNEVYDWVLKNKMGLSKDEAKRIFHRYRSSKPENQTPPTEDGEETPSKQIERQSRQISQILSYMEENTERLGKIENDIDYIKEKVDSILKRL